jgi:hypothetical protein
MGDAGPRTVEFDLAPWIAEGLVTGAAPGDWVTLWLDEVIGRLAMEG